MGKRIVLFIMQVWISLALWGQTSMYGLSITKEDGLRYKGKPVELIKIVNKNGITIKVTNYAASLAYISAPDRSGAFEPVVLGLDSLCYYWGRQPRLNVTVRRFANRVKNAEFGPDDKTYYLDRDNKEYSIHGGIKGFNLQVFETDACYIAGDTVVVAFGYLSLDMEGEFLDNLNLSLTYKLTNDNEVILDYIISTDRPTVINLISHSYPNLTECKESTLSRCCMTMGGSIAPIDSTGVSTGELMPVTGTEYDFSALRTVEHHVKQLGRGCDINYKLNKALDTLTLTAKVVDPISGRVLKVYTTEPGMQFYTPASDLSYLKTADSSCYGKYFGFCLEMQHFPDFPHYTQFPITVLLPGKIYRQTTIYEFEAL